MTHNKQILKELPTKCNSGNYVTEDELLPEKNIEDALFYIEQIKPDKWKDFLYKLRTQHYDQLGSYSEDLLELHDGLHKAWSAFNDLRIRVNQLSTTQVKKGF